MDASLLQLFREGRIEEFVEALDHTTYEEELAPLFLLKEAVTAKPEGHETIVQKAASIARRCTTSEALSVVGLALTAIGKTDEAKSHLRRAVAMRPVSPYAYFRLANAYALENDFAAARETMLRGLAVEPLPEAYQNLGYLENRLGNRQASREAYRAGWQLDPFNRALARKTIEAFASEDRLERLGEELADALQKSGNDPGLLAMLALVEYERGDRDGALLKLNRAVSLDDSDEKLRRLVTTLMLEEERYFSLGQKLKRWVERYGSVEEHLALARCRIEAGFLEKAKEGLDAIADRVGPHRLAYRLLLAHYHRENHAYENARAILEELYANYPHYMPLLTQLVHLYNTLGESDRALALLERSNREAPAILMHRIETQKTPLPEEVEKLADLCDRQENNEESKASMAFSVARGYDKLGRYEEAAAYLQTANRLLYGDLGYSADAFEEEVDRLIALYDRDWLEWKGNRSAFGKRPVFIVGMPRSGTTMLEQIFAAHEAVFGAGELPFIQKIIRLCEAIEQRPYPYAMLYAPRHIVADAGRYYIELTERTYRFDEPVFVDKLPHNFLHAPLLLAMFPDAKVIALRRDYRAIALSNYFQKFAARKGKLGYAFDLEAMGRHLKDYLRIMAHYRRILPRSRYREFWYEDLVRYPEKKIPEVLSFCELDFTPKLLEFYKNKTAVRTASVHQVRNPIYTRSAEKWRHYEKLLAPVVKIVGTAGRYSETEEA